ncbi:MAG: O-methyltransferase [Saprospiraceae bacterium]|nr:MAG: O-methyltransferase [Saprospiraceae bacterium]
MKLKKKLEAYCEQQSTPPSLLLQELERETHLKTLAPQMLSGPLQGRVLSLLSHLVQPKQVVEIGTFTAYATICMAEGLAPGGTIHTIEANQELEYLIRKYIRKAEMEDRIQLHIGQAQDIIPTLEGAFDMVFIDAGKQEYLQYYELIIDRMNPGGLILADNVLWSGKVLNPGEDQDAQVLHQFNQIVLQDSRVEQLILPLRDGLMIARKL